MAIAYTYRNHGYKPHYDYQRICYSHFFSDYSPEDLVKYGSAFRSLWNTNPYLDLDRRSKRVHGGLRFHRRKYYVIAFCCIVAQSAQWIKLFTYIYIVTKPISLFSFNFQPKMETFKWKVHISVDSLIWGAHILKICTKKYQTRYNCFF